ncbi:plasmid replication initiation protein [Sulfitobacter undariae]|uniref:Plasmid replication initiation protein n=1 Tax=Sulfitobacter undariae TaxID=1563671 RepID=A0A7W6H2I9_9RHOB|nr:replication initiator protein A [Sulfitobacter undariae]MBB3996137.1 plasmid replication initiation protein [Sulfitobacter undariae]
MALFPVRHPQRDFFVLDISDVVPKDDTASMEHPIFSLATKPDMRHLEYRSGNSVLKIRPSAKGLPTIFDKDILIFCISQLMHLKNQGKPIGKKVRFSARELLMATNRKTGGNSYQRLEDAFSRLQGAQFVTNIRAGGRGETRFFSLIESGSGFVYHDDDRFRLDYCEVILSDWLLRAIESTEVVTISNDYFRLRRPLERRLYEIARKHCGNQKRWQINLDKLQAKTGSNAPLKRFRLNLRQVIEEDNTPFYQFHLGDNDMVTVRPRKEDRLSFVPLSLKAETEDQARAIAHEKGLDYYAAEQDWREFAQEQTAKGNPPKSPDGSFIGWLKKRPSTR